MSLVQLKSYTERKGWEVIATLTYATAPIAVPDTIGATHPSYKKEIPKNLPFFWLSLADPTPQQKGKFSNYLEYLGGGGGAPRCCQVRHEDYWLYLMPPDRTGQPTSIKCCYSPCTEPRPQKAAPPPPPAPEDVAGAIHPRFLKTQSQIHAEWILGGFAELIHNSKDAEAKNLSIDVESDGGVNVVHLIDDGVGMKHKDLVRMLCFGHEDEVESQKIGKFGVGFKTGSMRIGDDAIVFTCTKDTQSVGILSQTANNGKKTLSVPIVTWKRASMDYDTSVHNIAQVNQALENIYQYSPFKNAFRLQSQFEKIGPNGTHVVIYNLRTKELDFTTDKKDIRVASPGKKLFIKRRQGQQTTDVPIDYSLKALCRVMFLVPKMAITIRKEPIVPRHFAATLDTTEKHSFKGMNLVLGFNKADKAQGLGGFMMYWHGVLIQAYHRIGIMIHNTDAGNGVIGVVECNALEPLNNKQAFNEATEEYRATEEWLERCLTKYWYGKVNTKDQIDEDAADLKPENTWVQCNKCSKWRLLPAGSGEKLPKFWFCRLNSDKNFNSCEIPEQDTSEHKTVSVENAFEDEPQPKKMKLIEPSLTSHGTPTTKTKPQDPTPTNTKPKTQDITNKSTTTQKTNTQVLNKKPQDKKAPDNKQQQDKPQPKQQEKEKEKPQEKPKTNLQKQGSKLVLTKKTIPATPPSDSASTSPATSSASSPTSTALTVAKSNTSKSELLQRAESKLAQIDMLMSSLQSHKLKNKEDEGNESDPDEMESVTKSKKRKFVIID